MVAGIAGFGAAAACASEASPTATARLVACDEGDCLLIRGARASDASTVRINDHIVEASGARGWQVRLPVDTVRRWSASRARTVAVAVVDPLGRVERSEDVRLPIGLLGHDVELASLVIRRP